MNLTMKHDPWDCPRNLELKKTIPTQTLAFGDRVFLHEEDPNGENIYRIDEIRGEKVALYHPMRPYITTTIDKITKASQNSILP